MNGEHPSAYGDRVADVYDDWYADVGDPMPAVLMLAGLANGGPALELGIGTGRIALPLMAFGVEVVGIEASQAMVDKLRAKPGGELVDVVVGDFADVGVEGRFPLIYLPFNTFFYLMTQSEQIRCLRNVAERLDDGGRFVMDAYVPQPWHYVDNQRTRVLHVGLDAVRLDVAHLDPVNQVITSNQMVLTNGGVHMYPVSLRYAWPAEIDAMAIAAGLELEVRYGYYDRRPFDAGSRQHVSIYRGAGASD
jgi:SAM-dependent methyltransferase